MEKVYKTAVYLRLSRDEESEKEVSPPKTEAETKKQAPSIHTKEDDLKSNNTNVYNIDNSKTIFTKLTEEMFDNLYSPSKKSKYVYWVYL